MQLGPAVGKVFQSAGEEQKSAMKQVSEYLELVEKEMKEGKFKGMRFFGGEKIGMLDIVLGCGSYWLKVLEEEVGVLHLADPDAFPCFRVWLEEFENAPEVKAALPAQEKLMDYARGVLQMILKMTASTSTIVVSTAVAPEGSSAPMAESSPNDPATA